MYLIFDTETTGLPKNFKAPITDTDNWPRCIQIAWQLHDEMGQIIEHKDYLIKPEGYDIPYDAEQIHGISTALAENQGVDLKTVLIDFNRALSLSKFVVGQNIKFDLNIMGCEFFREELETPLNAMPSLDTCTEKTANYCQIKGGRGGKFKLPNLTELHQRLFGEPFGEAHNATADVEATTRCFFELIRNTDTFEPEDLGQKGDYLIVFRHKNTSLTPLLGLKHLNLKKESQKYKKQEGVIQIESSEEDLKEFENTTFSHLHNHSRFSLLSSTIEISILANRAAELKMPAVAMTDTGNLMGAFKFVDAVTKINKGLAEQREQAKEKGEVFDQPDLKGIIGAELYVCEDHLDKSRKDNGFQVVFLAKNFKGYINLSKMSSIAYTKGFYYVPRIDRSIIEEFKEDIIVLSGNLSGEIPYKILNVGEKQAEESLLWWKEQFGEDFYLEIMRHDQENENHVNTKLIEFSQKHQVKLIATNNTYYLNQEDSDPHDILLCVRDGEKKDTEIGRGRGFRFGMPNEEYYFKNSEQMKTLFKDIPQSITNIQEIIDKIEPFRLRRDVLLPAFEIPERFISPEDEKDGGKRGENAYLRYLTYEGAKERYPEITDEIRERLDFELEIIAKTGYPGYFLIVNDFCDEARKMDVVVGPGRGSAAGSVVAYCVAITNVDPMKYDLLFERFLNPDRVSMPDIDIDFDDEGRQRVIDYVIDKYGANQVAQIITYGSMAAKSSIRDTARVLDLPLYEADIAAKLIPGLSLKKIFSFSDEKLKEKLKPEEIQMVEKLKGLSENDDLMAETINKARILEGSLRNTGIHACGVIITPGDITNYVPVAKAKDSNMYVTQYDNSVVEDAGLLKMDFLGLKTLTLIKDAIKFVKKRHNIDLVADDFPLDDLPTYELFQRGETVGIFQYESGGMQKYMRELIPTKFEDLIAMNALYRPGPIEYIPAFIRRKHGEEPIIYDLDDCQEYLEETYGITVYQEQVMLLSQKLAGFTKGQADGLRKAMGKKIFSKLMELKPLFLEGGKERGHAEKTLEKIWKDWEAFASYAFNKSHSTCYAWIAYQTAYLKANYPSEYMASILSNNMSDIKTISIFMEECKRMGIEVLGPDVNESSLEFSVNESGAIRFGMAAIKGVGTNAVNAIVSERDENGFFTSVYDVFRRIDLSACNRKAMENLVLGGGFDSFKKIAREQFFIEFNAKDKFLDILIKYGKKHKEIANSEQLSLFGDSIETQIPDPQPKIEYEEWSDMQRLAKEKEVVGIYITAHPLDTYKMEYKYFVNETFEALKIPQKHEGKELKLAGMITEVEHRTSAKTNKDFGVFTVEDYRSSHKFMMFNEEYLRLRHLLNIGHFIYINVSITKRYRGEGFFINITNITPLQDVLEQKTSKLVLLFEIDKITLAMIEELNQLIDDNPGTKSIEIKVIDIEKKLSIDLPSRNKKIDLNTKVLEEISKIPLYSFKVR